MPAPSTSPLFATDATYTADGDTWSGDPTKVDPGATRRAEGYEPDTLPAEWLNFQIGLVGDWIDWHESELLESGSRTIRWSPWTGYGVNSTGASPAFKSEVFSSGVTEGVHLVSSINFAQWILPLSDLLPDGVEVLTVTALVQPGAARTGAVGSGTEKMYLTENLHIVDFSGETSSFSTSNVDSTHADSDTSICKIVHPLGITIDRQNSQLVARLTCGFDSGANEDKILGWEATYTGRKWR
jgi:hypothetical protein